MTGSNYLFVYGTLLAGSKNSFSSFLEQNSRLVGSGTFQGELYLVDWYPGAVKSESIERKVIGQVVEITSNVDEVLANLDEYEGISQPPQPKDEYLRVLEKVSLEGQSLDCWIYLYQGSTKNLKKIISGDFISFQKERKIL